MGISDTGPASVTGQSGDLARIPVWVRDAWTYIQGLNGGRWKWKWSEYDFNLTATYRDYDLDDLKYALEREGTWCYDTSVGRSDESYVNYVDFQTYKVQYDKGDYTDQTGKPHKFTILPDGRVRFYPTPDQQYTIRGDYYKPIQYLADDNDIPDLPTNFHMVIAYYAIQKYGDYEEDPTVIQIANQRYEQILYQMQNQQVDEIDITQEAIGE